MFTKLAAQSDLPALNEAKEFPCGDKTICVANVNGEITPWRTSACIAAARSARAVIEGGKVDLPVARLGSGIQRPARRHTPDAKVAVYPVKIEGGDVLIEI